MPIEESNGRLEPTEVPIFRGRRRRRQGRRLTLVFSTVLAVVCAGGALLLAVSAREVKTHLITAASIFPQIEQHLSAGDVSQARTAMNQVQQHTESAQAIVSEPLWEVSSRLPLVSRNVSAVADVSRIANSLVKDAGEPMLDVFDLLNSEAASPLDGAVDLAVLNEAAQGVAVSARAFSEAAAKLEAVDRNKLIPQLSEPLREATRSLLTANRSISQVANLTNRLPNFLGATEPRNYLVLIQSNAELRATGGMSGALAVLKVDKGKMELTAQATASELGKFIPSIPVDGEQEQIFSSRLGSQISGVNLTPDFPSASHTAKMMWETSIGTPIDGVLALDPVVLSHILTATGPLPAVEEEETMAGRMPLALTSENVVKTLLSDVYTKLNDKEQDQYFAATARRVFDALVTGKAPATKLVRALVNSVQENRLHIWSAREPEQQDLASSWLGGSTSTGPDAGPGSFGVFFNDGTGSKMHFYARHQVQLTRMCGGQEGNQTSVRVRISNEAPADAATSLPAVVTGGGNYGVPPGTTRTDVVVYGPSGSKLQTVSRDGLPANFAPHFHGGRPVGLVTLQLLPGETSTIEFNFQNDPSSEINLVVTPTSENPRKVLLPIESPPCD